MTTDDRPGEFPHFLNPCPTCGTCGTCHQVDAGMMSGISHNGSKPHFHTKSFIPDVVVWIGKPEEIPTGWKKADKATLEMLAKRMYVAKLEIHAEELQKYGAGYIQPPTLEDCRKELGLNV